MNRTSPTPGTGEYAGTTNSHDGYYSQCDRCGFSFKTAELVRDKDLLVCSTCKDEDSEG